MKEYELSVMLHPDLEMNPDPAIDKVKKLIDANGGKIIKEEPEGKKRLNYPIKGNDFALYYYYTVELPSAAPNKMSGALEITDEVIRYMIVKADPRRAKYVAAKAEAEAAAGATAEDTKDSAKADAKGEEA